MKGKQFLLANKIAHGHELIAKEDYKSALPLLLEAEKLDENKIDIHLGLCICYAYFGQWFFALQYAKKAQALQPEHFNANIQVAQALLRMGRVQEAFDLMQQLKNEYPDSVEVNILYTECLSYLGLYDEAKDIYKKLLLITKEISAYSNTAYQYIETGDFKEAMEYIQMWLELFVAQTPKAKSLAQGFMSIDAANESLLILKKTLDNMQIPFMLTAGTLLGIYRDGSILPHDKDYDIWMPFSTPKAELIKLLAKHGFIHDRGGNDWNISFRDTRHEAVFDIFFVKPENNKLVWAVSKMKNKILYFHNSITGISSIEYLGVSFNIPKNPEIILAEFYGADWIVPKPNYNTLILGENIDDKYGLGLILGYNHCLSNCVKGFYKKAHGLCLQILSVHEDELLERVKAHIEKHFPYEQYYEHIPYRPTRTNNLKIFG